MILTFGLIPLVLYIRNRKGIPVIVKEESMQSREFWMFVGSLLFFISAVYIIVLTSLPFINAIFGTKWAIGHDVEYVYNRVMILVAFVLGILTAITQYLKYKDTPSKYFFGKIVKPSLIALVAAALISYFGNISYDKYGLGFLVAIHISVWAGVYTVIANGGYILQVTRKNLKAAGASVAHIGFGLMLIGILISSANKELISVNRTGKAIPGLKDVKGRNENPLENITLIHGVPTPMGKYTVTYVGDSAVAKNNKVYFKLNFTESDTASGRAGESFEVTPNAFLMKEATGTQLSSNPGSKHYLSRDIFVYITSWLNPDKIDDTSRFRRNAVKEGDTIFYSNGFIVVQRMLAANKFDNKDLPVVDSAWLSDVKVFAKDGREFTVQPAFLIKDNQASIKQDTVISQSLIIKLERGESGKMELGVKESGAVMRYITLKAYKFPFINILWLGTIVMVIGFMMSMVYRLRKTLFVVS
jgi:cytochrome c-type biogenesis protein CcmF